VESESLRKVTAFMVLELLLLSMNSNVVARSKKVIIIISRSFLFIGVILAGMGGVRVHYNLFVN